MKVTFLGGGNMGAAIVGGLVARGFPAADITVVEPGEGARQALAARFGVAVRDAAGPRLPPPDALVLAVKPQQMRGAVKPLLPLDPATLVVTIAAGIAGDTLSMGMTQDYRAALAEGSTMLRIGTAIFGAREPRPRKEGAA